MRGRGLTVVLAAAIAVTGYIGRMPDSQAAYQSVTGIGQLEQIGAAAFEGSEAQGLKPVLTAVDMGVTTDSNASDWTESLTGGPAGSIPADTSKGAPMVYLNQKPQVQYPFLGGSKLTMLSNTSQSQMLSVIIETGKGSLIVVDGGMEADKDHLVEMIQAKGGRVSAWLVTHPHDDHIGALTAILEQESPGIEIDNIYYSLAEQNWYEKAEPKRADMVSRFRAALSRMPEEKQHGSISQRFEFVVDDATVRVLNDLIKEEVNPINNSSIVYRVTTGNGKKILFLGDMGMYAETKLVEYAGYGNLKCDIVQMAHHGQGGITMNLYKVIDPLICLWPTPQWLWNNDSGAGIGSGPWSTIKTRMWMDYIGVKEHFSIKDGDQVIE